MNPTTSQPLISAQEVSYCVQGRTLLRNVSLKVYPGEIISIVGPNGGGKTTLIKLMLKLIEPTKGVIHTRPDLVIGYVPQRLQCSPLMPLSVQRFCALGNQNTASQIQKTLQQVGVDKISTAPMNALSGGELQRVLLARAILRQPDILVLDEPAQGVDLKGQDELYALIGELQEINKCTVLLVSHDLNVVMAKTSHVICLNQHICCYGDPKRVSQDPAFAAIFGTAVQGLAVYTHAHDHAHDVHGHVQPKGDTDES